MSQETKLDNLAFLIKFCKNALAKPLALMWNASLKQGRVPQRLKEAIIIPILKPGKKRTDPEAFRPVSLTSHLAKIFERVIKTAVQHHLESNNLLGSFQHGFRQQRSCLSQLLAYQDKILLNLESQFIAPFPPPNSK